MDVRNGRKVAIKNKPALTSRDRLIYVAKITKQPRQPPSKILSMTGTQHTPPSGIALCLILHQGSQMMLSDSLTKSPSRLRCSFTSRTVYSDRWNFDSC